MKRFLTRGAALALALGLVWLWLAQDRRSPEPETAQVPRPYSASLEAESTEDASSATLADLSAANSTHQSQARRARSTVQRSEPCTVIVVDRFENPIAGASVAYGSDNVLVPAGVTGPNGTFDLPFELSPPLKLAVRAPGFGDEVLQFPASLPTNIRVVLHGLATIEGIAVLPDGGNVGAGIRVVAYTRQGTASLVELAVDALAGDPRVHQTTTDESGRFSIAGLSESRSYALFAGGNGLLSLEGPQDLRPGGNSGSNSGRSDPIRIEMWFGHAVAYAFVETNGQKLTAKDLQTPIRFQTVPEVGRLDGVLHLGAAVLAGLPPDLAVKGSNLNVRVYASDRDVARAGPVRVLADPPGYRPIQHELWTLPLRSLAEETLIPIQRTASGFGSIQVRLTNGRVEQPAVWRGALGTLVLTDESGGADSRYIRWLSPQAGELTRVPYGRYLARFVSVPDGTFVWPPPKVSGLPVHVSSEAAEVEIDCSTAGSLMVEFENQDGSAYGGRVLLFLTSGEVRAGPRGVELVMGPIRGSMRFERSPCLLPLVGVGSHVVMFDEPAFGVDGQQQVVVQVAAQRAAHLRATEIIKPR